MFNQKTPSSRYRQHSDVELRTQTEASPSQRNATKKPSFQNMVMPERDYPMRFSFDRNKKLCFSNLKNSIKPNQHSKMCENHANKKAKFRDRNAILHYCFYCAIQMASQGRQLYYIESSDINYLKSLVEDCTRKVLQSQQHLYEYYRTIREKMLQDMYAHHLYYDTVIKKVVYIQAKDRLIYEYALYSLDSDYDTNVKEIQSCYTYLSRLLPEHSYEYTTKKCVKTLQKAYHVSSYKFNIVRQDHRIKAKLENIDQLLNAVKLHIKNSYTHNSVFSQILRSNSTFESYKRKDAKSVQDTPYSLKNKLSVCKSIVDNKYLRCITNIYFCYSLVGNNQAKHRYQESDDF